MAKTTAYTEEEVREMFIEHLRALSHQVANHPEGGTVEDRCNCMAFSILSIFDGASGGFPAMDISLNPHDEDKAFLQAEGEKWFRPGMVFNNCVLHELYYQKR
jgi:hypothetical protein